MRNSLTLCLLFIFLSLQGVNIIPLPREYETLLGGEFQLTDKTQVRAESKDLQPIADYLIRTLEKRYGVNLINVKRGKQSIYLMIDPEVATAPEGYFLNIGPKQIVVTGFDEAGVFYGVQSLLQCFHVEASTTPDALLRVVAPIMIADDAPAMSYRAVRLLPSHGQKSVDEMKQLIDHLAYRKINRLHWRLNDASHLIYVSEQYPLLALGSIESKDQPLGTFSANQMRELVDYASSRHVALVPEIEEPQNDSIFRKAYGSLYAADSANLTEGRFCLKKGLFCTNDPTTFNIMKLVVHEMHAIFGGERVSVKI